MRELASKRIGFFAEGISKKGEEVIGFFDIEKNFIFSVRKDNPIINVIKSEGVETVYILGTALLSGTITFIYDTYLIGLFVFNGENKELSDKKGNVFSNLISFNLF